jgi:hypothetical protein
MYELLNGDALRPRAEISIVEVQKYLTEVAAEERRRSLSTFAKRAWTQLLPQAVIWSWHMDAICEHLAYLSLGEIRFLMVNVPPRMSKPCWEEELVVEQSRGSVPLREIKVGDRVLTHRGRFRDVLEVHEQGAIPTLTINTRCGRALRLAPDHPVLTTKGWIAAGRSARRGASAGALRQWLRYTRGAAFGLPHRRWFAHLLAWIHQQRLRNAR